MAIFAVIENDVVVNVVVADSKEFAENLTGKQCVESPVAAIGDVIDWDNFTFAPKKLHASWVFDEDSHSWVAPVAYPEDDSFYEWDEDSVSWRTPQPLAE